MDAVRDSSCMVAGAAGCAGAAGGRERRGRLACWYESKAKGDGWLAG